MNRLTSAILALSFLILSLSGCATFGVGSGSSEPMTVDVRVSGLDEEEQVTLEKEIGEISGVEELRRDPFGDEAVYTFEYTGDFERLVSALDDIPYPGLEPSRTSAQLSYNGFDNRAPSVELISPKPDELQTETEMTFVIGVQDADIESVTVNGKQASARQEGLYEAPLSLADGDNTIEVVALDEAGNETRESYTIEVDTTPPDVEATIKVVVEGKVEPGSTVFVDGQEADVNMFGKWRIEVEIEQGQRTVEVVAIDKAGNKSVEEKPLGR